MKITKGHYVPKELITSKAVHEAVVKCFVAAGFRDARPDMGDYKDLHEFDCIYTHGDSDIALGEIGLFAKEPLTLQQLFTAENGLQWPDFATEIRTDDNAVWFFGSGQAEHICGSIQPIPHRVLAARQPKEKEVENEALDNLIIDMNGVFKTDYSSGYAKSGDSIRSVEVSLGDYVCSTDAFDKRAKELGFIGKYRWGVEYPTNGKRPELPDDVLILAKLRNHHYKDEWSDVRRKVGFNAWGQQTTAFKIVDDRFKPADTSYLDEVSEISENKPDAEFVSESLDCKQNQPDISDLIVALSDASNLAVDLCLLDRAKEIMNVCKSVKDKTEREKVIEVAVQVCTGVKIAKVSDGLTMNTLNKLYDAGMLVLPPKKSDTED